MQNPQLHTTPGPAGNQEQNQAANVATPQQPTARRLPNIVGARGGWYPRWWIISAFFSSIIVIILILLWNTTLCYPHGTTLPFVCNYSNWPSIGQIPFIWVIFLALWYPIFSIGMKQVEIPGTRRNRFGNILRLCSQFGPVFGLIILQGCAALLLIILMWWLDRSTPLSFAFLCILIFLANCSFFQRLLIEDRITALRIYALIAFMGIVIDIFFKPNFWSPASSNNELPLLCIQIILCIVGIITFFWHPHPNIQSADEQSARSINQLTNPFAVLGTIWPFRYIFPPRPVGTEQQGDTETPGQEEN